MAAASSTTPCLPSSFVALDVDGTLSTASAPALARLEAGLADLLPNGAVFINTARPEGYCQRPSSLTTRFASLENHFCQRPGVASVPLSKVLNMLDMQTRTNVARRECGLLVDDRPENVDAVRAAGFSALLVDESTGIRESTVDSILAHVRACRRHGGNRSHRFLLRMLALLLALVAIGCWWKSTRV